MVLVHGELDLLLDGVLLGLSVVDGDLDEALVLLHLRGGEEELKNKRHNKRAINSIFIEKKCPIRRGAKRLKGEKGQSEATDSMS